MSRKKTEKRVNEVVVQFSKQHKHRRNKLCKMKVSDFTVELVAADTKQPFKEHMSPDGQVYAEVEPDVDYFMEELR